MADKVRGHEEKRGNIYVCEIDLDFRSAVMSGYVE